MLMLSRKAGEVVRIGPHITILISRGGPVELAIDAPRELAITREESIDAFEPGSEPRSPRRTALEAMAQ